MMPWWFYILTPFGWLDLYLTITVFIHELGHLIMGLLTGHKITKFKLGLYDPIIQFQIRNILFEFSLDGMSGTEGSVSCDTTKHVSQIAIFLTAMAGPAAVLLLATGVLWSIPIFFSGNYEPNTWQYICKTILLGLSLMTYWIGFGSIERDLRNILVPKN